MRFPKLFAAVALALASTVYAADEQKPGVSLRVWDISDVPDELPKLVPGQTANINKVVDKIDLSSKRKDFGDIDDSSYAEATGQIHVDQAGDIAFRLYHDDGVEMIVDEKSVCLNAGPNGGDDPEEFTLKLTGGDHPYMIRLHDQGANSLLRLEWKLPGSSQYEVVPATALRTNANEVLVVSPGEKQVVTGDKRPGNRMPLVDVHPSLQVINLRPDGWEPKVGGIDVLPDGRLIMCIWDPAGEVVIIDGADKATPNDHSMVKIKQFASGLAEPLGIRVIGDRIFVLQKQELTELIDTDHDGVADVYRCVSDDWLVSPNFHEFAFGLVFKDNKLFFNLAIGIDPGGKSTVPQKVGRGTVRSVDIDTGKMEIIASGLRTPNGIGLGPDNEIFILDNQGDWLPASTLMRVKQGVWYGNHIKPDHPNADAEHYMPPTLWLPQGEIGNSPSSPIFLKDGIYAGQILHGDVTYGGLQRDFLEKIDGEYQGCVFRFTQGLEGGINRTFQAPDGTIYVGGVGTVGNWGQNRKLRFGFQKLVPTGKIAFEPLAIRAKSNGFEIELTKPLANAELASDPASYVVHQWNYKRTSEYGGPKIGDKILAVKSATLSEDRKHIVLEIPNLQEDKVTHIRIAAPFKDADGNMLWNTEGWYTLNHIPKGN